MATHGLFETLQSNIRGVAQVLPDDLPAEEDVDAAHQVIHNGPFSAYMALRDEAAWLAHAEDEPRLAIVTAASAAEVLANAVLIGMLVDERAAPEKAVDVMKISLAKRLSSQFHDRLGGVWDANKRGSITYELRRDLLRVRNRTVHAGQDQVSYVAKLAVDRLSDFEGCICGLVAARSTSFPRTSWLLHEAGLLAGSALQHLTDLRQSEDPLDWSGITQRLGELAMRRAYDDGAVAGEDPDALSIVIVVGPDDEPRLWVHDDHASSAAPLDRSPPSSLMTQLGAAGPPPAPMTIPTTLDQPDASILEWQNDYDVLPGYEVRLPDKAE